MLKTIIKLLVVYFVNKQLSGAKEGLVGVKASMTDYAESRAEFVRDDFLQDLQRMLNTILAYFFVFTALVLAGVIALLWIFAIAWESPNRALILSLIILGLLSVSIAIYAAIRYKWKNHYFMSNTNDLIAHDWQLFTNKLASQKN
jgi:hypothetical protein